MTIASVGSSTTTPPTSASNAGSLSAAVPGGKLGKNEFLKLLTTQLRYQDPLNPMQGDEMAAQLAQFASVEQLVNIGDQLTAQQAQDSAVLTAINNSVAMSAIGKTVLAPGANLTIPADSTVTAHFGASGTGKLEILDSAGKVVGTRSLGTVSSGLGTFDLGAAGAGLSAGSYTYRVTAADAKGVTVPTTVFQKYKIDGVSYGADGAMLTAGSLTIPIGSVIRIQS